MRVQLLWVHDYHDAPLSGLAEVDGTQMWFDTPFDEPADDYRAPRDRECFLYEFTRDELAEAWRTHELFERWVSTQHCYHLSDDERDVRDRSTWHLFYDDHHSAIPDIRSRQSVGTFRLYEVWEPRGGGTLDESR